MLMENFKKNKLWYSIILLFIVNWLCYFFHSIIGIGIFQSFVIDSIILLLIFALLSINHFKISVYKYVNVILIIIITLIKNYFLYQFLNNFP